jgi:tetratricopeptide (TPR) repeat protein
MPDMYESRLDQLLYHANEELDEGDISKALKLCNDACIVQSHDPSVLACMGYTFYVAGQLEEAAECFDIAVFKDDKDVSVKRGLAFIYAQMGDERAHALLEELLQNNPDDNIALSILGDYHMQKNEPDLALHAYLHIIGKGPMITTTKFKDYCKNNFDHRIDKFFQKYQKRKIRDAYNAVIRLYEKKGKTIKALKFSIGQLFFTMRYGLT